MKKLIALLLIISTPAFAADIPAIKVKTGDVVKPEYDQGTLMDKEKAEKIRDELIDKDAYKKENESYKRSIELYRSNEVIYLEQKDMLLKQNIELTKTLNDTRSTSTLEKIGLIILGAGILYGASRLTR